MSETLSTLIQSANALVNSGRWIEAEKAWQAVHKLDVRNAQALFGLGFHAYQRGVLVEARRWLDAAVSQAPGDVLANLTLASVCREQGDSAHELRAIEAALVSDAYHLPALLLKAAWFERTKDIVTAADLYRNALKVAPQPARWPEALKPQLQHAAAVVQNHAARLAAHLQQHLTDLQAALPTPDRSRWKEAADVLAGRCKPYHAQCNQLHVPRLPAIPFYKREQFPWLAKLEAKTDVILKELLSLLAAEQQDFTPYISYAPGQPVNQWQDLNHSQRWSAFHLWRGGVEVPDNTARCPDTAAILRDMQLAEIDGLCPNVLFSALAPHTHIPPHHGETNARLVAHLPLVVPEACLLRVGYEQRTWTVGETLIFDDCIEHEARNDSDQLRVVLIFDLWNPLLSQDERRMVQAMTNAMRTFQG